LFTSWEVRKPSKKWIKGTRHCRVTLWATKAKSCASCTEPEAEHGKAGAARRHHVLMIAKDRQPLRREERAATWNTAAVSSPAILYMLGSISIRP
jgi:hypothetical protein